MDVGRLRHGISPLKKERKVFVISLFIQKQIGIFGFVVVGRHGLFPHSF